MTFLSKRRNVFWNELSGNISGTQASELMEYLFYPVMGIVLMRSYIELKTDQTEKVQLIHAAHDAVPVTLKERAIWDTIHEAQYQFPAPEKFLRQCMQNRSYNPDVYDKLVGRTVDVIRELQLLGYPPQRVLEMARTFIMNQQNRTLMKMEN